MKEYQQRVIEEKAELDAKIQKLYMFLASHRTLELDGEELWRLYDQNVAMRHYSYILAARIAAFKEKP